MAAGFQVFNDNNILQIDEFYKNMVLTMRGSSATDRPGGTGRQPYPQAYYSTIPYPVSSRQPVLALRGNGNVCFITEDNGFVVFSFGGQVGYEYFVYDLIGFGNPAGNTGMQVFDYQGNEVFNSNNNYMRVLGSYSVDLPLANLGNPPPVPTHSGSVAIGKRVAVCMSVQSTGYSIQYSATGQPGVAVMNVRYWQGQVNTPSENGYVISNAVISAFGGPGAMGQDQGAVASYNSGLLIDVTGI